MDYIPRPSSSISGHDAFMELELMDYEEDTEPPLPKPRLIPRFPNKYPLHSILSRSGSRDKSFLTTSAAPSCLTSPALSRCSSNTSTSSKGVRFSTSSQIHSTHSAQAYDRAPYRECQSLEIPSYKASEAWIKCLERNLAESGSSNVPIFTPPAPVIDAIQVGYGTVPGLIQDDSSGSDSDDLPQFSQSMTGLGLNNFITPEEDDDDTVTVHERFGICALNGNWTRASLYKSCDALGGF